MKKLILIGLIAISCACTKASGDCGNHNGKQLYKGPEGGCYYMSSGGNKEYVDRSECKCN